ncbi:MAG TPA: serine hydrolase [Gemmatimonadaceae bacterium]|jgi:beta-lactamase class A
MRLARASIQLAFLAIVGQAAVTSAQRLPLDSVQARIARRVAEVKGAIVGVAFRDLQTGDTLYMNADDSFNTASTMKIPVLIELYRRADAKAFSLDQPIPLANEFKSLVDGSPFTLVEGDDSDSAAYAMTGTRVPIRTLIEHMITRSSNLATNTLIAFVGAKDTDSTAHALGARNIHILRGVEDTKAVRAKLNNTTTARDLDVLMEAIETGRAASPVSTDSMRAVLLRQEFNGEIPAGLPAGVKVAHKTGWINGSLHDAAIVYPPGRKPYVLVLLTRGIPDQEVARKLMVDVSRLVYQHVNP